MEQRRGGINTSNRMRIEFNPKPNRVKIRATLYIKIDKNSALIKNNTIQQQHKTIQQ